ncbi:MAG: hypothetical protein JST20_10775 [Bacteroidetes bacterium]|nr:hypothetical protein [Bacteroidota bacterium]
MKKNGLLFSLCIYFALFDIAHSQETPRTIFERDSTFQNASMDSMLTKFSTLNIQHTIFTSILYSAPTEMALSIPVDDERDVTVDIKLVPLWTGELQIMTQDSVIHPAPLVLCYRGTIRGLAKSLVAFTFSEGGIMGVVSDSTGNYVVSPIKMPEDTTLERYCVYNDKDLKSLLPFSCGNVADSIMNQTQNHKNGQKRNGNKILTSECQFLRIHVECEFEMYQHFSSSLWETSEYIINLFNVVGAIYKNEDINIFINNIFIWTTTDPYTRVYNDPSDKEMEATLDEFIDERETYTGNIAYLFRKSPGFSGAGGRADEIGDDLCDDDDAYAFQWTAGNEVLSVGLFSPDAYVFAHELGHLLNSVHTHHCSWDDGPIDNCNKLMSIPKVNESWYSWLDECDDGPTPSTGGGTIMSYCGNCNVGISFANGFGPQPGGVIREWVDDYSYCMSGINSTACFQNITWTSTNFLEYERETITASSSECVPSGTHGPVNIENTSGAIFWLAGQSISLRPGFHKKNLGGTFNARVIPWIDCEATSTNGGSNHSKSAFETFSSTEQEIAIIPNPATDEIQILGNVVADVELFSSIGLSVLRVEKGVHKVDVSQLSS